MPNTGRQRFLVEATWGASSKVPASYVKKRLDANGIAKDPVTVTTLDLSDSAIVGVLLPAAIGSSATGLKFMSRPTLAAAVALDATGGLFDQDADGDDLLLDGIQSSLSRFRTAPLDLCARGYTIPVFVDGSGAVAPGAITVTFLVKE